MSRRAGTPRSTALCILWAILTLGIYTLFWTYWTFDELQRYRGRGFGGVLGLVIYVACVAIGAIAIAVVGILVWSEINQLYEEDGRPSLHLDDTWASFHAVVTRPRGLFIIK